MYTELLLCSGQSCRADKIDSIYFNLKTSRLADFVALSDLNFYSALCMCFFLAWFQEFLVLHLHVLILSACQDGLWYEYSGFCFCLVLFHIGIKS